MYRIPGCLCVVYLSIFHLDDTQGLGHKDETGVYVCVTASLAERCGRQLTLFSICFVLGVGKGLSSDGYVTYGDAT